MEDRNLKGKIQDNKKVLLIGCMVVLFFSMSMLLAYRTECLFGMNQSWSVLTVKDAISSYDNKESVFVLDKDTVIKQDVAMVSDEISGIALNVNLIEADEEGKIKVEFWDKSEGVLIHKWEYNLSDGKFEGFLNLYFDRTYTVNREHIYTIAVEGIGFEKEFPRLLKADIFPVELQENAMENGVEQETLFSYKILNGGSTSLKYFWIMVFILSIMSMISLCILLIYDKPIHSIFVVVIMLLGIIYLFVIPPFVVPDEGTHFVTAYNGSNILMGKEEYNEEGCVIADKGAALYLIRDEIPTKDTYIRYIKGVFGRTDDIVQDEVVLRTSLSLKHPGYIPQIIGITVARLLGMNAEQITLMGRLFALIFYAVLMYWSIKLIPFWKTMLFIIGILPMTIQQIVSYNYDSVLFAICFFAISYMLYLKYEKLHIDWKDYFVLIICAVAIATIKFVYLLIFGVAILIPKEKFGNMVHKIVAAASVVFVSGGAIVLTRMSMLEKAISTDTAYQNTEGLIRYTLQTCIADPINTFIIFYRTFEIRVSEYLVSMLATPLGWLDISVPQIVCIGFIIILLFSVMIESDKVHINIFERSVLSASSLGVVLLTLLALLIDYTYVGSKYILGVQGRYFLPLLPIMLIILQSKDLVLNNKINKYLLVAAVATQLYTIWYIVVTVVSR